MADFNSIFTGEETDDGTTLINSHAPDTGNPHGVTKTQVGLAAVNNKTQLPLDGSNAMLGSLNMGGQKTINEADANNITAYSTVGTIVSAANTLTDIPFANDGIKRDWVHDTGLTPEEFEIPVDGDYEGTVYISADQGGAGTHQIEVIVEVNGVDVVSSQRSTETIGSGEPTALNSTFQFTGIAGQIVKFKFAGSRVTTFLSANSPSGGTALTAAISIKKVR